MKSIKALLVVTALSISSLAMAEGGADRTFAHGAGTPDVSGGLPGGPAAES